MRYFPEHHLDGTFISSSF